MTRPIILAIAVLAAGCGEMKNCPPCQCADQASHADRMREDGDQIHDENMRLLVEETNRTRRKRLGYPEREYPSLSSDKPTAAVPHDFETSTAQANITREQLAGIYRRLVELEKRTGIRDAEGEKIEAGPILMGDTHTNPNSLQEIDREYRESQESPRHEH